MKAIVDRNANGLGSDVQLARSLLQIVPNPPNETDETIADILDRGWAFRTGGSMVLFAPRPDDKYVEIIWWLPLATWTGEGLDVLIEAIEEIVSVYGKEANGWMVGGQFNAPGSVKLTDDRDPDTDKQLNEYQRASLSIVLIHRQWFSAMRVFPDAYSNYYRGEGKLSEILAAAKAWRHGP